MSPPPNSGRHAADADEIKRREEPSVSHQEPGDLHVIVHHTELPQTRLSNTLDRCIRGVGSLISWAWLALAGVIVLNVTMRYVFGEGRIELEEIQWHIYAGGFLFGMSYVIECDDHVRVDLIHASMKIKTQAWIEFFGILFFLMPFIVLVLWFSAPFIASSYEIGEVSQSPGGLPFRWVVKGALFVGFALMGVATLSRLLRVTALLFGLPRPLSQNQGA